MDSALGWIGDIVRYLGRMVPRLQLVRITERGIKFVRGRAREVGPGLHVWWPVTTEMEVYMVVRQILSLEQQIVQTQEGKTLVVDGVLVFTITDLYVFLVENHDAAENMAELAQAGLRKAVLSTPLETINGGRAKFDNKLTSEANKSLNGFGVDIESMRLQSCAEGQVLIHSGSALRVEVPE